MARYNASIKTAIRASAATDLFASFRWRCLSLQSETIGARFRLHGKAGAECGSTERIDVSTGMRMALSGTIRV